MTGATVANCEAKCSGNDECAGFNYHRISSGDKCYFRKSTDCSAMTSDSNRDCYTKHVTPGIVVTGTKQNQNSNENNHGRYFNWADNAQWDEVFGGSFYSGKTYDVKVCRDKSEIY